MGEFTHFDEKGNARMVDVSEKDDTERVAVAVGSIFLNEEAMQAVLGKKIKKGDVLPWRRLQESWGRNAARI